MTAKENKTLNRAVVSMITGAFIWFFYTVFIHTAEAKVLGISQLLTGSVTILGAPWTVINPLIIALPISTTYNQEVMILQFLLKHG